MVFGILETHVWMIVKGAGACGLVVVIWGGEPGGHPHNKKPHKTKTKTKTKEKKDKQKKKTHYKHTTNRNKRPRGRGPP